MASPNKRRELGVDHATPQGWGAISGGGGGAAARSDVVAAAVEGCGHRCELLADQLPAEATPLRRARERSLRSGGDRCVSKGRLPEGDGAVFVLLVDGLARHLAHRIIDEHI